MTQFLTIEDALVQIKALGFHLQDAGLLEAALARPKASVSGQDAYPTLSLKAAALMESVIRNHSLLDGNKRCAWLLMVSFLFINGYRHDFDTATGLELALGVAEGRFQLHESARVIEKHLVLSPIA